MNLARTRSGRSLPFASTVAVAVTLIVTTLASCGEGPTSIRRPAEESPVRPGLIGLDAPLGPDGTEMTLDAAVRRGPVPALRPQTEDASDETVAAVWVRSVDIPEIFIVYENGITVAVRREDFADTFEGHYTTEIGERGGGEIIEVAGIPAFVIASDDAGYAEADVVIDRYFVQIVSDVEPLTKDALVRLVSSTVDLATDQDAV
jgi:hypothetical protein